MTNKIKELRKIVPIPIGEAMQLLKENDGDIEKCVYLFKAKSIAEICKQTGCDEAVAARHYEEEKLDINRAVSVVKDTLFDAGYTPIGGLTAAKIRTVYSWFHLIEEYDLGAALSFSLLNVVAEVFSLIPETKEFAVSIGKAKVAKDIIFEGYADSDPLEEFVRRSQRLDDDADFSQVLAVVNLQTTTIKEILNKHLRNLVRLNI
ncbi:hypothetical protein [Dysgonomonas sp. 511]|uniref:hypothetical protein n=1 Tax=Dysgonomonas sp. 511 TaxID=2302930 RepID=UPI0013D4D314|nr:hypothetical protein [Dysgonomonas sp. 511]NDV78685.1 hypothetical protein [Dysgonomonas sp. 511]